jgi:iron(III) transport system substrate-binding protein
VEADRRRAGDSAHEQLSKEQIMKTISVILVVFFHLLWVSLAKPAAGASLFEPWGPMSKIETEARKEGKLVFYVGAGLTTRNAENAMSQYFQERYGIAIDWTSMNAREIAPRVFAEQRTKQHTVDLAMVGSTGSFTQLKSRGYVVPILAPSTLEKDVWRLEPAASFREERDWMWTRVPLSPSLLVNTKLVSSAEEPKSYKDLLDTKWKGKIVIMTPAVGGSGSGWFFATYRTLGLDYMRALAKQVVLVAATADAPNSVARGLYSIAISPNVPRSRELIKEGAPVKFVHPKEGSHLSTGGIAMILNAPHANAAKLFLNWFYTREGQMIYAPNMLTISVRKDVPQDYLPEGERYLEGAPILMAQPEDLSAEKSEELYKLAKEIFEAKK